MEQGSYSETRSERAFGSKKEMDQEIHKILLKWNSKHSCKVTTWTDYTSNSSKSTQTFTKQKHTKQHLVPKPKKLSTFPFKSKSNVVNKMRIHGLHPPKHNLIHKNVRIYMTCKIRCKRLNLRKNDSPYTSHDDNINFKLVNAFQIISN
jgi:hypothetical protein